MHTLKKIQNICTSVQKVFEQKAYFLLFFGNLEVLTLLRNQRRVGWGLFGLKGREVKGGRKSL